MNQYDIRNHVLRSDAVKALEPEEVTAWAQAAEDALGLTGTSYTAGDAERAAVAVVLQVNFMVARPADPNLTSHKRGAESKSWQRMAGTTEQQALDPVAVLIVAALAGQPVGGEEVAGEYSVLVSLR